jgi:hypothetical protein
MTQFKVGDRVRRTMSGGHYGVNQGDVNTVAGTQGVWLQFKGVDTSNNEFAFHENYYELVTDDKEKLKEPVNFILQYELDTDPFETFATMKEVEARIKELAKRTDLKRESIKVYEIAKTFDVKLETRIIFGGVKVKLSEKAKPKKAKKRKYKHSAAYLAKKAAVAQ